MKKRGRPKTKNLTPDEKIKKLSDKWMQESDKAIKASLKARNHMWDAKGNYVGDYGESLYG